MTAYEIDGVEGVFGVPSDADLGAAHVIAAVVCPDPTCDRRGQFVQVHADTVQPVRCGGTRRALEGRVPCNSVLHCDHPVKEQATTVTGTLANPVAVKVERCTACGGSEELERRAIGLHEIPLPSIEL